MQRPGSAAPAAAGGKILPPAGAELVTGPWLAALALLVLNDHVGKGHRWLPGWLTGKLSDVAGLFLFPVLLVALARGLRGVGPARARWMAGAAALTTGGAFALLKLSPALAAWASARGLGLNRADATDLLALPAAALAVVWYRRWSRRARPAPWPARGMAALAGLLASAASRPPPVTIRPLPAWARVSPGGAAVGCGTADAWVSKSGKTGLGLGVVLAARERCQVTLGRAALRVGGVVVATGASLPQALALGPDARTYVYLPFVFDNDRAWRTGDRGAEVALDFTAAGGTVRWTMPLVQRPTRAAIAQSHPFEYPGPPLDPAGADAGAGDADRVGAKETAGP